MTERDRMRKTEKVGSHRLLFEPMGISYDAVEDQSILEIAHGMGIYLRSDCGGKGRCGKCRILVHPKGCLSQISRLEYEQLTPEQLDEGYRLACQAKPVAPGTITIPQDFLDSNEGIGKTGIQGAFPVDPMVERIFLDPSTRERRAKENIRDLVKQTSVRVKTANGKSIFFKDPVAIRDLSRPFVSQGGITLVSHRTQGVTGVLQGECRRSLGLAVDVGTTTIAIYLSLIHI